MSNSGRINEEGLKSDVNYDPDDKRNDKSDKDYLGRDFQKQEPANFFKDQYQKIFDDYDKEAKIQEKTLQWEGIIGSKLADDGEIPFKERKEKKKRDFQEKNLN